MFTTLYDPQTDGQVERYNQTITDTLKKEIVGEGEWTDILSLIDFNYNCSPHVATDIEPYRAMFGSLPFEFDNTITLEYHLGCTDRKKELWERLTAIHQSMHIPNHKAKTRWLKHCDTAVKEIQNEEGDRFYVFDEVVQKREGRKLRTHWRGP